MAINAGIQNLINSNRKLSNTDVNNLFYYYYGRTPNSSEISYWTQKTSQQLASALKPNAAQFKNAGYYKDVLSQTQELKAAPYVDLKKGMSNSSDSSTWSKQTTGVDPIQSTNNLNTTPLGDSGVNALFKLYYGRDASQEELNYWRNKSDAELRPKLVPNSETELAKNKPKTNTPTPPATNNPTEEKEGMSPEEKAKLDALYKEIETLANTKGYSPDQIAILRQIALGNYTSGKTILSASDVNNIIEKAAIAAEADLQPFYENQRAQDTIDLQNKMADIRNQAARYTQQEALSYQQLLNKTKSDLRSRGLTFSGQGQKQLGQQAATINKREGEIPQERRYDIEDERAKWQEAARTAGLAYERAYGSASLPTDLGTIPDPYRTTENQGNLTYSPTARQNVYLGSQVGTPGYVEKGTEDLNKLYNKTKSTWDRLKTYGSSL